MITCAPSPNTFHRATRRLHRGLHDGPRNLPGHCCAGSLPQGLDDAERDGRCQSTTNQSISNQPAALRLPALDGADRPAEETRRLLMRPPSQIAKHDRRAIFLRQAVHLLVNQGVTIGVALCPDFDRTARVLDRAPQLVLPPPDDGRSETRRRAAGDLMKPRTQRVLHPERSCLADQHQERGLEGILGVMLVAEDGQADAPDQRLVPLDQRREGELGHLVRVGREPLQELTVGQVPDGPNVVKGSELANNGPVPSSDYHGLCSSAKRRSISR